MIGAGFGEPYGLAVDAAGNVFVADTGNNAVKEIPYSAGTYGIPVVIDITPVVENVGCYDPAAVALDAAGNLFVSCTAIVKVPYSAGAFGTPLEISDSGVFFAPAGIAINSTGDVFVPGEEIPYLDGSYGSAVQIAGYSAGYGLAMDATGNIYYANGTVYEIPYGNYNTSVAIGSNAPGYTVAVNNANGRLYSISVGTIWMFEP